MTSPSTATATPRAPGATLSSSITLATVAPAGNRRASPFDAAKPQARTSATILIGFSATVTSFASAGNSPLLWMRFHSAPVIRLADAKPVHLGHVARADGAWRLYIFADQNDPADPDSLARNLCEFLASSASPVTRFTPVSAEPDSVIDVRAIFQQNHRDLAIDTMPSVLLPRKGKFSLIDYEKVFCADPDADDIFGLRGVNRETGCMLVVRPDQYVSHILPLHDHQALVNFFARILIDAN